MKETTATDIISTLPPEKVSLSWTTETLNIHLSKVIEAFVKLVYEKDGGVRQLIEERTTDYKNRFAAVELDQQHKWDSQEKAVRLAFEAHDAQMHTMFEAQEKFNQQRYDNQVQSCNENFDSIRKTQIASTQESDQKVAAMFEAYKTSKQQRWEAQEKAQDIAYRTIEKQMQVASIEHDKQISTAFAAQEKVHQQRWESQERAVSAAFLAQEKLVKQAMDSAQLAVAKSETAMEKRFECVHVSTPILCSNLKWKSAGELKVGDELVGFDEHTSLYGRKWRKSVVLENSIAGEKLFKVSTPKGNIRCNAQHPWLVLRNHGQLWMWINTDQLTVGDTLLYKEFKYNFLMRIYHWTMGRFWNQAAMPSCERTVVTSIEDGGISSIARLSTSTATFIAAGFFMHNSMNEFRDQLRDQAALFLQRTEFNAVITSIAEKVDVLATTLTDKIEANVKTLQGKMDTQNSSYAELRTARDTSVGKSEGLNQGWLILLGIVSLIGGVISIIVFLKP